MNDVRIDVDRIGRGTIHIDGEDFSNGVFGTTITHKFGELTEVELDLAIRRRVIANIGDADILIPDVTRKLLVKLGWTPPAEDGGES